MIPSHRSNGGVDRQLTAYVLLAGVAGGLVLAVVVLVCCKICLRTKKTLARDLKEFDPDELLESGLSHSWAPIPDSGPEEFSTEIELQEIPKKRASTKGQIVTDPKHVEGHSDSSSPERPPEPTSVVRRRSSVGIQRQASVCLSDEEDQAIEQLKRIHEDIAEHPKEVRHKDVKVAAIVHRSCNDKPPRSWDQTSACSSTSQPVMGVRHPPFIHSHSSPDPGSAMSAPDTKHGRVSSATSLHGIPPDTLARVVDLEDYHYSRQQVWELATQGATLLKDKSQSSLDVAAGGDDWTSDPLNIQQAASTEAGLLEKSLEQHQLEHLQTLLKRYSPVDEEDVQIWSKVRYNDTGSREDIREEVIEMISGESSDDSVSSVESELLKQQSRQLWELRATLEEEKDDLSEAEGVEDPCEDVPSELPDIFASRATSVESNADVSCDDPGYECDESDYLQLPTHELRRHCYKSLLGKRLQKRTPGAESSFDSWESSSTDRTEGATTSFESTTDNTDSTGEGQTNRLQQMKADSGYKSMESNGKAPRLCRKQLQFTLEGDSVDQMMTTMEGTFDEDLDVLFKTPDVLITDTIKPKSSIETSKVVSFEGVTIEGEGLPLCEPQVHKKKFKSALKKHCTESDIQWSMEVPEVTVESRGKTSVFQRFFRSSGRRLDHLQHLRDYSIDEKSDALFREFSRPDSLHRRLHHRASEGGSSPRKTVLSPQVSIEEESGEEKLEGAAAAAAGHCS